MVGSELVQRKLGRRHHKSHRFEWERIDLNPLIYINGGGRLHGEAAPQGAKGCALLLAACSFLAPKPVVLSNVPGIADISTFIDIALDLRCDARYIEHKLSIDTTSLRCRTRIHKDLGARLRVTPTLAAALLVRTGSVKFPNPGGDSFCERPINLHLAAMEAAGASIIYENGYYVSTLSGAHPRAFKFSANTSRGPSLGATATSLILAARGRGTSLITNPSPEPEIAHLVNYLRNLGVLISYRSDGALEVTGSEGFRSSDYVLPSDRIEAGSLAIATMITSGQIKIMNFAPTDLPESFWSLLYDSGAEISFARDSCVIKSDGIYSRGSRGRHIITAPHPGFPTDLQPQAAVLATQVSTTTRITEGVHKRRSSHVLGLQAFGADVEKFGSTVRVRGRTPLRGATVVAADVRCAVAYVLAGLISSGETIVSGFYHLSRGHEDFAGILHRLGAEIRCVSN
ncbi:UDP-N-acetylglucosamine 1-carboxyvinyltransferase [Streptomyces sp. NBC_00414]|uniref:UDP-N-acetylglucosamine 1-carboxyvinyltransferase n=1 Tax=Streptomyces sp. NBC_00414 TaxID=2975739 RepID=UPI003FA73B47